MSSWLLTSITGSRKLKEIIVLYNERLDRLDAYINDMKRNLIITPTIDDININYTNINTYIGWLEDLTLNILQEPGGKTRLINRIENTKQSLYKILNINRIYQNLLYIKYILLKENNIQKCDTWLTNILVYINDNVSPTNLRQHQTTPMLSFSGSFGSVQPVAFSPDLTCTLKGQYVRAIRSGKKTFEGRVATPHFRSYVPGKTVEWFAGQTNKVTTEIVSRREFRSFREMLTQIGYDKFVPEVRSLEEAVRLYDGIPGYSEKAQTFGALALEVRVISPQYMPRR